MIPIPESNIQTPVYQATSDGDIGRLERKVYVTELRSSSQCLSLCVTRSQALQCGLWQ